MNRHEDFNWFFDRDYCGRIFREDFSNDLKRRVAEAIQVFRNFNVSVNPSMPYIAAWREDGDKTLWYEFVGHRLLDLFSCQSCEVADIFRESLLKRYSYHYGRENTGIEKRIFSRDELADIRSRLRAEVKETGCVEAVYKISLQEGKSVWVKDLASVEYFPADRVCLSLGALTDVSLEMEAEEQHEKEEEILRKRQARMEQELERQSKELWKTQLEMIYRLARAAHQRDGVTGLHISRMSRYCRLLAEAAGLSDEECELLVHASPIHDVGKICVSRDILQKPGKLTAREFELMKSHSVVGAKLLSGNDAPLLKMARTIALTHHERWDGSGYPHGLAGGQIPLTGRIAAICDVFDALTSERPYKKAWPLEEALSELSRGRGSHFDPELIDLFLRHKDSLRELGREFAPSETSPPGGH